MHRISYIEKGAGLHEAIAAAGHWIAQIDGVWFASSPDVQSIINQYSTEPLAVNLVSKIKQLAGEKINAQYPQWRQLNMLARYTELSNKENKSIHDFDEMRDLESSWEVIKSIRRASDVHEQAVYKLAESNDFGALLSYQINTNWPQ